jgi:hypothetical protein
MYRACFDAEEHRAAEAGKHELTPARGVSSGVWSIAGDFTERWGKLAENESEHGGLAARSASPDTG